MAFKNHDDREKFYEAWKTSDVLKLAKSTQPKSMLPKVAKRTLRSSVIAILLTVIMVSTVLGAVIWFKSLPSTVNITASYNANLYDDSACTIEATQVVFASIDRLDTTNWYESQVIYLKYVGSGSGSKPFKIEGITIPIGFEWQWKFNNGAWHTPSEYETPSWVLNQVYPTQIRIKQTAIHTVGAFNFVFEWKITD